MQETAPALDTRTVPPRLGPRPGFKVLGIFILLVAVSAVTGTFSPSFASEGNVENLLYRTAMFSILGIGVAFVIITGGIDLSLGSVVALIGCLLPMLTAMSYRAIDQALVLEAYNGETKIAVLGDFTKSVKSGDTIYLSSDAGKASMVVQSARFDPNYKYEYGGGISKEATVIDVAAPMKFDAYSGFVSRNFKIARVEAPRAGSGDTRAARKTLLIENLSPLPVSKDLLRVVKADGTGAMELPVVDSDSESGNLSKVLVRDRDNQLTPDYAFATVRPHQQIMTIPKALAFLLTLSALIGLSHGLLITRLKLQPFVVTLCGLLIYRGVIRYITNEQSQGFGSGAEYETLKYLSTGAPFAIPVPFLNWIASGSTQAPFWAYIDIPMSFLIMAAIAIIAAVFLNRTIFGRYLLALGRNEQAARFSGINTDRMTVLAYVICSLLAGFGGILFILNDNSGQPSNYGNFYELYAIAAAVLGGCSLRGGEGSILGVVIGAALMQVLRNAINLMPWIGTTLEFAVIGAVILIGVISDELVKRLAAKRRAARQTG